MNLPLSADWCFVPPAEYVTEKITRVQKRETPETYFFTARLRKGEVLLYFEGTISRDVAGNNPRRAREFFEFRAKTAWSDPSVKQYGAGPFLVSPFEHDPWNNSPLEDE